ncbi:MAG TPA: hemerythrin domain-containing protein [Mycobacterium sp.]
MAVDAFEMAMVHRVFRDELHDAPGLVRGVGVGDTGRSTVVGAHLDFIVAGLHHHHAAEDELLWPKLRARVPAESAAVARMESAHHSIADATTRVQAMLPSWVRAPEASATERLAVEVEELSLRTGEHLTDEESAVVPLIDAHVTEQEWREVTAVSPRSRLARYRVADVLTLRQAKKAVLGRRELGTAEYRTLAAPFGSACDVHDLQTPQLLVVVVQQGGRSLRGPQRIWHHGRQLTVAPRSVRVRPARA